jgi:hypothetical protein
MTQLLGHKGLFADDSRSGGRRAGAPGTVESKEKVYSL